MKKIFAAGLFSLVFSAGALAAETIELKGVLDEFAGLDSLYQPAEFKTRMISTTDPAGGNRDWDNFLEKSGERAVLAEISGPGIITRIFTADPRGRIKIILDQQSEPLISLPAAEFFAGKAPPFTAPFTGNDPSGYSYFPILFASHARIEIEPLASDTGNFPFGRFWQVEWLEALPGIGAKTISLPLSGDETASLERLKAFLSGLRDFEPGPGLKRVNFEKRIEPGQRVELGELGGPGVVRKIRVLALPDPGAGPEQLLASRIFFQWDFEPEPSVDARLADFFGNPFNTASPPILVRRLENGGEMMLPMPFAKSAVFAVENRGTSPGTIRMEFWLEEKDAVTSPWRFHAFEREERLLSSPGKRNLDHKDDYLVLAASGRGRFVAAALCVFNRYIVWWGEGDESFELDGERNWVGTGTEDYFDGSFMRFGRSDFAGALVRNTVNKGYAGLAVAYRLHLLDPVYFQDRLRFSLEHGLVANDLNNWYRSVAYWYQSEPHASFAQMAGQELDLSPETIKREVDRATWRTITPAHKALVLLKQGLPALLLLAAFLAIILLWLRRAKRRN